MSDKRPSRAFLRSEAAMKKALRKRLLDAYTEAKERGSGPGIRRGDLPVTKGS